MACTREFVGAVSVITAVTLVAVYVAPFADLLQLSPFPPAGWLAVIAIVIVAIMWSEPFKRPPKRVT